MSTPKPMSELQLMRILSGIEAPRPSIKEATEMFAAEPVVEMGGAADKHSANGWSRVAEVRSSSDPSTWYVLGVRQLKTGKEQIGCSCPGWIYAKGDKKPCKHIKMFLDGSGSMKDIKVTPFGAEWMKKNKIHESVLVDTSMEAIFEGKSEKDINWMDVEDAVKNEPFDGKDKE